MKMLPVEFSAGNYSIALFFHLAVANIFLNLLRNCCLFYQPVVSLYQNNYIAGKLNKTEMVKVQFEYVINCSPKVLFNRLSTASGLAEWFADDVRVQGKRYTFCWKGSEQTAEMILRKENRLVRYSWVEESDTYFEFKITQDELTNDVSLIVVDFSEENEEDEARELWNTQIADLKHILGS